MSAHTPGPWAWGDEPGRSELSAAGGHKVLDYAGYEGMWPAAYDAEVDAANLRLIAAAPMLLKACQQAIGALKGREHDGFLRDAIVRALHAKQEARTASDGAGARPAGSPKESGTDEKEVSAPDVPVYTAEEVGSGCAVMTCPHCLRTIHWRLRTELQK